MADIDPIVVQISAEFGDLKRDLAKVKQEIKGAGREAESAGNKFVEFDSSIQKVSVSFGTLAVGLGVVTGAMAGITQSTIKQAKEIDKLSKRVNVNRVAFSGLAAVVENVGGEAEDLFDVFKDLNVRITDAANGAKAYEDVFKKIGISSKDLVNLSPEEQVYAFADAIHAANEELQLFAIDELLSDPGVRMIEVLRQGGDAMREMGREATNTGTAFREIDFEILEEAAQSQREMNAAWQRFAILLSREVAPIMTKITDGMSALLGYDMRSTEEQIQDYSEAIQKVGVAWSEARERLVSYGGTEAQIDALNAKYVKKIQDIQSKINNLTGGGEDSKKSDSEKSPEVISAERMADMVLEAYTRKNILIAMATQEELAAEQARVEAMEQYRNDELNRIAEFNMEIAEQKRADREKEEAEYQAWLDRMFGADKRAQEQNRKLWEAGWKGKTTVASKFLGQISNLMNTNSRKQFEIGKAAAIAQVAIDTPKSAMSAYSAMAGIPVVGPALGAAAAAAAVATGVAQIQNIKSQSFGGGGNVGGAAIGAGGAVGAGTGAAQEAAPSNVVDATFVLQGEGGFTGDQIRGVAAGLNDFIEDGGEIRSVSVI